MTVELTPLEQDQPQQRAAHTATWSMALPLVLFGLILLAGAFFRFNGLDWDQGRLLHPDERHITDVIANRISAPALDRLLDPRTSTINPRSVNPNPQPGADPTRPRQFAYGSLPLFITDVTAWVIGLLTGENWNGLWQVFRVGRVLTVLFDLATITLIFALALRTYGTIAGLLAAAFWALAVLPTQLAHFWATDTWLTTFVAAALLVTLNAAREGRVRAFALAGFLLGCAMATKGSVILFAITIIVAAWLATTARERDPYGAATRFGSYVLAAGGATLLAFALFEPYAILDPRTYLRDIGEQSAIVSGHFDVPFTRQYVGTIPLVYQTRNLLGWGLGPLLGALALSGFAFVLWRAVRRRRTADLVLLAWVVPYLVLLSFQEVKFLRYLLPILPCLLLFGAALLVEMGAFGARRLAALDASALVAREAGYSRPRAGGASRGVWAASALAVAVLIVTLLMNVAYSAIYSRSHTRVAASEWIYANVPAEATLTTEIWDDSLPLILGPGRSPGEYNYEFIGLDIYGDTPACARAANALRPPDPRLCTPNTEATFAYLASQMARADYIVESSARLYESIPRLPWRYPVQQHYYELLFAERLGFKKVYENTSFPTLGAWEFDDRFMDESFTVYDHPRVVIFQKERDLSREELRALFAPALERPLSCTGTGCTRYPLTNTLLLPQLVDRLPAVRDYAWNRAGASGVIATVIWLLAVQALSLIALPLSLRLFRDFPDRGWGLSKLLGWLLLAYPVWLGASLKLTQFTLPYLVLALAIGVLFSAAAAYRWHGQLRAILRGAGPAIAVSEGVFLLAGAFFLALRLKNPDLWHTYWGGEKPMELAHLNAILRSANFPPYDPWYADGIINYYYYGQYLVAALVKLTGLPTEIAFNLAMPSLSALVAMASFSVAAALANLALRGQHGARTVAPLAFGVLGAVLLTGIGSLDGLAQIVARSRQAEPRPFDFGYFWGSSRAIDGAITEFPYFTQVWADLHAHVVALPFTILALGLVVRLATSAERRSLAGTQAMNNRVVSHGSLLITRRSWPVTRSGGVTLLLLAVTLGALACTNSWDVPTYLLVTSAGLFFAGELGRHDGAVGIVRRLAVAVVGTVLVALAAYLLYLPFFRSFTVVGAGGLARTRVPTALPHYLDHFGLFIGIVVVTLTLGLIVRYRRASRALKLVAIAGGVLAVFGVVLGRQTPALTAWLAERADFFKNAQPEALTPTGTTAALLLPLLILLITLWLLAWGEPRLQLPLTFLIAAVGVTLGPEIIFVADDLQGGDWERMNTVFKFYLQGWTLFAIGGAGALAWLYDTAPRWSVLPFRRLRHRADRRLNATILRGLVASFLALLLLASFVYPVIATPIRLNERFDQPAGFGPTLNGYRWMEYGTIWNERCEPISFRDDYAAIEWLNATIIGTPVIAEASIGPYRGHGSRFSNATGLPTILGWDRHQYQQRPPRNIPTRSNDVRALYNSADEGEKLRVIQRYHVSYVIVGAVERHFYYPPPEGTPCGQATDAYASRAGLATLERMEGRYLTPVFQSGETVIYRVLPAANSSGSHALDTGDARPKQAAR